MGKIPQGTASEEAGNIVSVYCLVPNGLVLWLDLLILNAVQK